MVAIAEALLRYETLQSDDVDRIMRGERLDKPTVADLLSAESTPNQDQPPASSPNTDEGTDTDLGGMMPHPA